MNCCPHLGNAHVTRGSKTRAGAPCTIPGCGCKGWVPHTSRRGGATSAKIRALFAEGLDGPTIAERLGCTLSFVYHARKQSPSGGAS